MHFVDFYKYEPSAKRQMMSLELKRKTIRKLDQEVRVMNLTRKYEHSFSKIRSVLKNKEL